MTDHHVPPHIEHWIGRTLHNKWKIVRRLGIGGTATVYEAIHTNGNRVAIKIIHREYGVAGKVRNRFLREAYVANAIGHPGTVAVLDNDDTDDGCLFLVMELLDGETLQARFLASGLFSVGEVLRVADAVLDVLIAAHSKQVIHRDLKPENIFYTRSGAVKVLDFGMARAHVLPSSAPPAWTRRHDSTFGTPAFMAPEQALGRFDRIDARTDLWSLGATLFTLLTGRFVHSGKTPAELLLAAGTRAAPSLGSVLPSAPPEIREIVDKALAFRRTDRWASALEMQRAVRAARRALGADDAPKSARGPIARAGAVPYQALRSAISLTSLRALVSVNRRLGAAAMFTASLALLFAAWAAVSRQHASGASPAPSGAIPDARQEVSIIVRASPPEARIFLDDEALPSNPYASVRAPDALPHTLRVEAPGYGVKSRAFTLERDVSFDLDLEREGAWSPAPSASTPAPGPPHSPAALRESPRGARVHIDTQNPYRR